MFKFSDGFDHYAPKTVNAADLSNYLTAAGYAVVNATSSTFNIVDGTDSGSLALRLAITAGSATPPSLSRSITTSASKVVFGFGFRGSQGRLRFARINALFDLDWDTTTGKMRIGDKLGKDVIIMNAWWYIEIEIDKTTNTLRVYANDTLQIEEVLPGGVGNTHTITWGMSSTSSSAANIELDDLYIVDSDGGSSTGRLGPVSIITRAPTADDVKEWTVVGQSATTHYTIAGQLEPGKSSSAYLQANVAGKKDIFMSNNVLPNDNQVFAVGLVAYARKGDLDDRSLGLNIETDGGAVEVQVPLTEAYKFHNVIFEQAPGDVAWNQNRVETSKFGITAR